MSLLIRETPEYMACILPPACPVWQPQLEPVRQHPVWDAPTETPTHSTEKSSVPSAAPLTPERPIKGMGTKVTIMPGSAPGRERAPNAPPGVSGKKR